jgi:hypothetical protein
MLLSQQIETHEIDRAKDMDTLDRSLTLSQELDASKKELEAAHASLTKDLEHLEKANKLCKEELDRLSKSHEQLQATHKEVLGESTSPINVENITCATNVSCDQASLIEENAKLKSQLEKDRLTITQGEKTLNEIVSQQRMRPRNQGLGFN